MFLPFFLLLCVKMHTMHGEMKDFCFKMQSFIQNRILTNCVHAVRRLLHKAHLPRPRARTHTHTPHTIDWQRNWSEKYIDVDFVCMHLNKWEMHKTRSKWIGCVEKGIRDDYCHNGSRIKVKRGTTINSRRGRKTEKKNGNIWFIKRSCWYQSKSVCARVCVCVYTKSNYSNRYCVGLFGLECVHTVVINKWLLPGS